MPINKLPAAALPPSALDPRSIKEMRAASLARTAPQQAAAAPALPGTPTTLPTPLLPNDSSVPQPTTTERAVIEAKWVSQREVPRSLAQLIILVNAHPEWLEWAREAEAGTMTFNR